MKVAFILSRCSHLGPFVVARDIVKNIQHKAETVHVFYLRESEDKLDFEVACRKIAFTQSINFGDYDVVHSHGFVADAYVYFHRGRKFCKHQTTIHQRIAPDYAMKYNFLVGYFFEKIWCHFVRKAAGINTLTYEMVRYYKSILKRNDIGFIYNGINTQHRQEVIPEREIAEIKVLKKSYKIIGISARLIFLKGIDQVIRSLKEANEFALMIIGDGEKKEELQQLATDLSVEDRCLFLGYKKNALDYFAYFDVYAMSSRSEGFGLCVIEAASQKIPIVCSDLPVYREIFKEDEVIRFELENISSLAGAFKKAIENSDRLSEKVYQKFHECFRAEIMAEHYWKTYQNLVKEKQRHG